MTPLGFVLVILVAIVAAIVGRITAPQPAPAPVRGRFGLEEAERVPATLGGLTPPQAEAAKVAAVVTGMDYGLPDDVEETRAALASSQASSRSRIADYEAKVARERVGIEAAQARDAEVANLATAFGV